jgi:hypothetical protein
MNMDLLKQQQNRGYVIAGGAAIIAFIAFFLPYVTASYLGVSASASGTSGGWLWLEEFAAIIAIVVAAVLIFRSNAFGMSNMPVDRQIRLGRITLLVAGILALVLHLLFLIGYQSEVGGGLGSITTGFSIGLGFGWFLFLIASIGMVVGAVMAYRQPITAAYAASQPQYGQPYPGQPTQYPPYQQPYPTTDQQQQPYPYQSAPQQYPPQPQQPYQQQYPAQPQQYPPTEMQQPPQQYPPQQR